MSFIKSVATDLRRLLMPWCLMAALPIPLVHLANVETAGVVCVYLGLGAAWIAAEAFSELSPASLETFKSRIIAVSVAVFSNAILCIIFGQASNIQSNLPFPLLAFLSVTPAVGLVPWLIIRFRQRYAAIIAAGFIVIASKLFGCIVARIVYGPDYIEKGFASENWHDAKLMISIFWSCTVLLSLAALLATYRHYVRINPTVKN